MDLFGLKVVTSRYVPNADVVDYSRPLWRRLLSGRTIEHRQVPMMFLLGDDVIMHPEQAAVLVLDD